MVSVKMIWPCKIGLQKVKNLVCTDITAAKHGEQSFFESRTFGDAHEAKNQGV